MSKKWSTYTLAAFWFGLCFYVGYFVLVRAGLVNIVLGTGVFTHNSQRVILGSFEVVVGYAMVAAGSYLAYAIFNHDTGEEQNSS